MSSDGAAEYGQHHPNPNEPPPPYPLEKPAPVHGSWHPKNWSRRTKTAAVVLFVVLVAVAIVAAVLATRDKKETGKEVGKEEEYPSYDKLNYQLKDKYEGTTFFDKLDYFTGNDPTSGFVHYVDQPRSQKMNLTYATPSSAILRVDTSERNASTGRKSVRIESKSQYDDGLFIFDIIHSPYGCGTWPALWLTDPANWPNNGEIDVMEAVNSAVDGNQVALHTTKDCSMNVTRKETGRVLTTDCLNSTNYNAGCGVQGDSDTFGEALNKKGGGIYAMELRNDGIRTWFFSRSSIPTDLSSNAPSPDPSTWGTALADFPNTKCSINSHFRNHSIIANIDLCGVWAGQESIYSTLDQCPGKCSQYVATNATAFERAYWEFGSFKVYQATTTG